MEIKVTKEKEDKGDKGDNDFTNRKRVNIHLFTN
jgi:hypothetical protein